MNNDHLTIQFVTSILGVFLPLYSYKNHVPEEEMVEFLYDETDMDLVEILLSDVTRLYNRWVFLKDFRSLCPVPNSFNPLVLEYFDHHVKN